MAANLFQARSSNVEDLLCVLARAEVTEQLHHLEHHGDIYTCIIYDEYE